MTLTGYEREQARVMILGSGDPLPIDDGNAAWRVSLAPRPSSPSKAKEAGGATCSTLGPANYCAG